MKQRIWAGLVAVGKFHFQAVWLSLLLLPGVFIGFWLSRRFLRAFISRYDNRAIFLIASGTATTLLVIRQF